MGIRGEENFREAYGAGWLSEGNFLHQFSIEA